jgi:glycine/D-amino acid oxidase-like deaminating enzyme
MERTADVVVVGAGLVGTSIAFQLARRRPGSVAVVERSSVGAGDSSLSFSLVRRHYSNPVTARLAMRGVDVIRNWSDEVSVGGSGYVGTGYLLTAAPDSLPALEDNTGRLQELGLDTRVVGVDEIAEIEPLLETAGIAGGAYEPDGGFADAVSMTLSWFAAAVQDGAEPVIGARAREIRVRGGRVEALETDRGTIRTRIVVLAAGAWGPVLAETAGVDLPISLSRVQVARLRQLPGRPQARVAFSDMASNLVFRPDRAAEALAVAYQPPQTLVSRDACSKDLDPAYNAHLRTALAERLPAYAGAELLGGFAGAFDVTPDWNPIVGWAEEVEGLYLALGWSGHGFKLAPAVGEVVAAEVLGETPAIDVSPLAPGRFRRGELLRLAYGPGARA